jgi:hypothetical protein
VAQSLGDTWHCSSEWLDATWPNQGLPRGILIVVVILVCKILLESMGFDPRTSHTGYALLKSVRPLYHPLVLMNHMVSNIFEFAYGCKWWGGQARA